jgi:cytochrome c oxidase cbb3-type subunit III
VSTWAGIFVTVIVLGNIAAALWLIWSVTRGTGQQAAKETTHVWDEDLTEYNNPLPRWWLWLFVLTIVFALGYLALYPGLGNYPGLLHWSSHAQWRAEEDQSRAQFEQLFAPYKALSIAELSRKPQAMATAKDLFELNCSSCHGSDARGAEGFPDLTDNDWLHGGSTDAIYQSIAYGRTGTMPTWGPVLGPQGVQQVVDYVLTLSGREPPSASSQAGQKRFMTLCVACHGPDGKGNQAIGAPNLTDRIWLWGGSRHEITETITNGRTNHMPAHLDRLGEDQVRLLAAYVYGLSHNGATAAQ